MNGIAPMAGLLIFGASLGLTFGQSSFHRTWTSTDGKSLQAEYRGTKDDAVALLLKDGKEVFVPLDRLSTGDNNFAAANKLPYRPRWNGWPAEAGTMLKYPEVKEEKIDKESAVYTTPRFRFHSDVNLGTTLMNDLARIFELTYHLHEHSPFGVFTQQNKDRFEAKLVGTRDTYLALGGSATSSGFYDAENKTIVVSLESMGIKSTVAGWRKIDGEYDPSTIVQQLTFLVRNDMLDNLPRWISTGYAEYMEGIPYQNKAFHTSPEKVRQLVQDRFVTDYAKFTGRPFSEITQSERREILRSRNFMKLPRIATVLNMTDEDWVKMKSEKKRAPAPLPPPGKDVIPDFGTQSHNYHRATHLILYYFIQIEGDAGIMKLRRILESNRARLAAYYQYRKDYTQYLEDWKAFSEKPGVTKLADGSIEFPADFKPPIPPKDPGIDLKTALYESLPILLDGKSKEELGAIIEAALIKDLGMQLNFQ